MSVGKVVRKENLKKEKIEERSLIWQVVES